MTRKIIVGIAILAAFVIGTLSANPVVDAASPTVNLLTDAIFGLEAIQDNLTDPFIGLQALQANHTSIKDNLTDPVFGLQALQANHTSIIAKIDALSTGGGTHLVEIVSAATVDDDDFVITCPVTSSACIIKGIYLDDDQPAQTIDPGNASLTINGEIFVLAADTGAPTISNGTIQLTNVENTPLGSGDTMRIEMTSSGPGFNYSLRVIAEVDVDSSIVVSRIAN